MNDVIRKICILNSQSRCSPAVASDGARCGMETVSSFILQDKAVEGRKRSPLSKEEADKFVETACRDEIGEIYSSLPGLSITTGWIS